jgi:hypothetical protein
MKCYVLFILGTAKPHPRNHTGIGSGLVWSFLFHFSPASVLFCPEPSPSLILSVPFDPIPVLALPFVFNSAMSPNSIASNIWLIEQLEKERAIFDDNTYPLLSDQTDAFKSCYDLQREDAVSLEKRSKQRRSQRVPARTLLMDVFLGVGPEVFILCVLALPMSKLDKLKPKGLILERRS